MTLLERLAAYGLKAMQSPDKARADALQAENDALNRLVSELKRALSSNTEADSLRETLRETVDSLRFARLALETARKALGAALSEGGHIGRIGLEARTDAGVFDAAVKAIKNAPSLALAQAMNRAYGVATQRLKAALEESGERVPFEGSVFDAAINALRNVENARAELAKERLAHSITLQAAEKWYKTGVSQGNPSLAREIEAKRKAEYEAAGLPYVGFEED